MNYALVFLMLFASLALFFKKNSKDNESIKKWAKTCPCYRLAKAGILSKILTFTSVFVFIFNGLYLEFIGFNIDNVTQLALALVLVFLSYKLSKDDYDRD